jgi:regulator of protease activity HflC (stomatin/prohibitin superfamily)
MTWGKPSMDAVGEGLHFKMPIMQTIVKIDVKTTKLEELGDSASRDLQDVQTTIALNYHLSPSEAPSLYQEIGLAYEERIIKPAIQEGLKSVTAKFTAEELITRRSEVRTEMRDQLRERLARSYILVDDFNIVNFEFSQSFNDAIEAKVTAEQLMLKADMDLQRIKIEAEQAVAQGEAEATVFKLKTQSMTAELVEMERLKIEQIKWNNWDGKLPVVYGSDAAPIMDMRQTAAVMAVV